MKKIVFSILLVLTVAVTLASGCTTAPTTTPAPAEVTQQLDIGVASPLTGPGAFLGNQIVNTILMAIEDQNAKGGVTIAGQKYTLNPIQMDTKADAAEAVKVAEKLIFVSKVKIIAGPFQADAIGVQSISEPNKVMAFFVSCLIPPMTGPKKPYTYFVSFPYPQNDYKLLSYTNKYYPEAKTIFSLEADIPSVPSFVKSMENTSKLFGYTYLGYEKFSTETRDFLPTITRALTKKPDIIDTGNVGGVMGGLHPVLLKQLREAGFSGPVIVPTAPPEEVLEQIVPAQGLNKVISQYINIDGPVVDPKYRDVLVRYKAKYNEEGVDIVTAYYNVMMGLFEFLNTQNTLDTEIWMQGFSKYKWRGLMGTESFWVEQVGDGINRRVFQNKWVTHYENGKPVTDYEAPIPWDLFVKPSP